MATPAAQPRRPAPARAAVPAEAPAPTTPGMMRVRATKFGFNGHRIRAGTVFTIAEHDFCPEWMVRVDAALPDDLARKQAEAQPRGVTRVARPGLETTVDARLPAAAPAPAADPVDSPEPTGAQDVLGE